MISAGLTALAALGCGGGGKTSDGGAPDAGADGGYGQYNTVSGTFQSGSGIRATFTGAMQGASLGEYGSWILQGAFDSEATPSVTVSSPAGGFGTVGIAVQNILGGSLSAATYTCAAAEDAGTPTVDIQFTLASAAYEASSSNDSGGPCTLTVDAPAPIVGSLYFAHGSMTATLVGIGALPDGGNDTGTMTATW